MPVGLSRGDQEPAAPQKPRPAHAAGPVPPELVEQGGRRPVPRARVPVEPHAAVAVAGGDDEPVRGAVGASDAGLRAAADTVVFLLLCSGPGEEALRNNTRGWGVKQEEAVHTYDVWWWFGRCCASVGVLGSR